MKLATRLEQILDILVIIEFINIYHHIYFRKNLFTSWFMWIWNANFTLKAITNSIYPKKSARKVFKSKDEMDYIGHIIIVNI
jgi:hypothetical protein